MSLAIGALRDHAKAYRGALNYIAFGDSAEITESIQPLGSKTNQIKVQLPYGDENNALEAMGAFPTGWAQISIVNLLYFPPRIHAEAATELIRLTSNEGIMIMLAEAGKNHQLKILEKVKDDFSFVGLEILETGSLLVTFRKAIRPFAQPKAKGVNRLNESSDYLSRSIIRFDTSQGEVGYGLYKMLSNLTPTWPHPHLHLTTRDSGWDGDECHEMPSVINEPIHQDGLIDQKLKDAQQNAANLLEENRQANRSIKELHSKLEEMTASFLSMQDSLHEVINSRAWKATAWPRVAFDTLKRAKRSVLDGSPFTVAKFSQEECPGDREDDFRDIPLASVLSPPVNTELDNRQQNPSSYKDFQPAWGGTFLQVNDNSTRSQRQVCGRILFIDWKVPEPNKDSGSCRIYEIIKIATSYGKPVDFAGNEDDSKQEYIDMMLELGIHPILGRDRIVRHLRKFGSQYSVIVLCRPDQAAFYAPLARCYCPDARLVFDTVDLHFLRFYRAHELSNDSPEEKQRLFSLYSRYLSTEKFLAEACDMTIVVSDEEKRLLSEFISPSKIEVIPNIHSIPSRSYVPGLQSRQGLLFIGSFDHAPNVDAVVYFCEQVLPLINKELPRTVFYIVGSNMPKSIAQLRSKNIVPIGFLEDLNDIYNQVRVFVAPLRYGAGLKGKVGQSMSHGVPVVGTSVAFEGFGLTDRKQSLIANSPEDFADAVIDLYSSPDLWHMIAENGRKVIESRFSSDSAQEVIGRVIGRS